MRLWLVVVCSAGFCLARLSAAKEESVTWHLSDRPPVQGQLSAVYGSVALLTDRNRDFFVPLERLDDAGLKHVADFLAAKPSIPPIWKTSAASVTKALRNRLEILRNGHLQAYDPANQPEPEIYLIYFSAHWCPPCQRFTPELVQAYHHWQQVIPQRFEVIYVSNDRSSDEQEEYARATAMPWPVLKYSDLGACATVQRWAGDGIPCLVALTPESKLICHSYDGDEYVGPQQVVAAMEALVPMLQGTGPEIRRARHRLSVVQHLVAAGTGNSPPKPYLVTLNPTRYQTLDASELILTMDVDAKGRVADLRTEPKLPVALQDQLSHDADDWLFLPAVEHGQPVAQTVRMPFRFGQKG